MSPLPSGTKIWLVAGITDMHNEFNGLESMKNRGAGVSYAAIAYTRRHILLSSAECYRRMRMPGSTS